MPELFLWSPSLEARSISNLLLYMTNEADKLRHSVLHTCSTSEIQIWDVSKNFQVPPFQQCKGMPTDCLCDPSFCVIYTVNHLLFWPYSGFIFHFIQPNCQLLLTSMVLLHLFWKYVPSAVPMLDTEIMWPPSVPEQCIASGKNPQHSKNNNPKTRDELSAESVPHSNPNHNLLLQNCKTQHAGWEGEGKWRMTISSDGSSQLALLKCSIKTALEVQRKRCQSTTRYLAHQTTEKC